MPLESRVWTALNVTALTTLVADRIYPLHAIQGAGTPNIIYNRVSGARVNNIRGYSNLENARIEVDIYTTSVDQLRTIGTQVIATLTASTLFAAIAPDSPIDTYDDELELYRRIIDFSIWNKE